MVDTHSAAEKTSEKEGEENTMNLSKAAWLAAAERAKTWPEGNGYVYFLSRPKIRLKLEIEEFLKSNPKEASRQC